MRCATVLSERAGHEGCAVQYPGLSDPLLVYTFGCE